ncbi:hypothetical protein R1sor_003690 [Riccia sorocarpa]|uniref:Uncharacterized protein n=1 Tax=Riccia sorocarpa TaxID=122646 RepID=A0ABD3H2B5_9MARC
MPSRQIYVPACHWEAEENHMIKQRAKSKRKKDAFSAGRAIPNEISPGEGGEENFRREERQKQHQRTRKRWTRKNLVKRASERAYLEQEKVGKRRKGRSKRRSSSVGGYVTRLRYASTTVASDAAANAAPVPAKKSRAGLWVTLAIAGATGIGYLVYPQLVIIPPTISPVPPTPANFPVDSPADVPPAAAVVEPPKPRVLSPREELDQRVATLKAELAELRKQKRNKLVNMKKRSIKDEIKMIENGIKKLEKA